MKRSAPGHATVAVPSEVEVLDPFVQAGLFGPFEVQFAASMVRLHVERLQLGVEDEVVLGLAVAARAPRLGHVCVELARVGEQAAERFECDGEVVRNDELAWPSPGPWLSILEDSALVSEPGVVTDRVRPLVLDGSRLYLQRLWRDEVTVAGDLAHRARSRFAGTGTSQPDVALEAALDDLFGRDDIRHPDLQRAAVRLAMQSGLSIIAGGPGTGKTHTVARLLAVAYRMAAAGGRTLEVRLAAPTGKAAQRMRDAVRAEVPELVRNAAVSEDVARALADTEATTIHRLLGWVPGPRFLHDRQHPLPCQLVIVDETSMVSLPLMARLLEGLARDARLVLVGDPFQLASIEAGTVLGDLVGPAGGSGRNGSTGPLAERVTVLRRMHRFRADSDIAGLAEAIRQGDADRALDLLRSGAGDVRWVRDTDDAAVDEVRGQLIEAGLEMVTHAQSGEVEDSLIAAGRIKLLAATRFGPFGLREWSERIEAGVASRVPLLRSGHRWYLGRPIIVTGNDPINRVANGDVGVVVGCNGGMEVALMSEDGLRLVAPSRLDRIESWWAMTIHKSQGSEFPHAVVSLPRAGSPILTRELLYTAVTRAKEKLTLVGSEPSLRDAIDRPVARASGLGPRLWSF